MDERTQKYVNNLSAMIRKETVSERNQEDKTKFLEFHQLLRELFPAIFAVCEYEEFEGSFLLKWKGTRPGAAPVLFMNHHDTVEAQGAWRHPAFAGELADGKLWGRGTLDTKGGLFGMLQAADELAAEGFTPECDIYFESACTEETDGKGAQHFTEVLKQRGIRFSFALDEGGMIMNEPVSGVKGTYAMIGMGEKGLAELNFIARGKGGHASSPEPNTPLVRLAKFITEVESKKVFDVELTPVIKEMLRRFAPSVPGALKIVYANPDLFAPILKSVMSKSSGTSRAFLQTTIAFTMAKGSDGHNVIPAEAKVAGNMRVSHHQGYEKSLAAIKAIADKYDIETEIQEAAKDSPLADYNSESFKLMEKAVEHAFPGVASAPYIMTGCSDCRFLFEVSDVCYHFVPFLIDKEQMESIHGINECVDVDTLAPAVDFYKYLMREVR